MRVGKAVTDKKTTVDDCWQLDMKDVTAKVDFSSPVWGSVTWSSPLGTPSSIGIAIYPPDRIRLSYCTFNQLMTEKTECDYTIKVESTPCFFGGVRRWFLCPACQRRCRILYQPPGEMVFACRLCHRLTYHTQQVGRTPLETFFKKCDELSEYCKRETEELDRIRALNQRRDNE